MKLLVYIFLFFLPLTASAQFSGHSGVYYLGTANIPISNTSYANPNVNGVVVRFTWEAIEPTLGNFIWSYIDNEIAKAATYHKKISLQPLDIPHWLIDSVVMKYYVLDNNIYHTTYGQIISGVVPWDSFYISRYKIMLQALASKYATDTTISYINTIGGAFSRNIPDTVIVDTVLHTKQPFWTTYNYNADTFGAVINGLTDYYMSLFPSTPLWCSVDYVLFEPNASNRPRNYLASLYTNYGVNHYSDRFGMWREDIAGCNPPVSISTGSQWYLMVQNSCRTGAQMLWSVQDGPARMNQCGIAPNTKNSVLDSAIRKAKGLGMRYLEIYAADIADSSLQNLIAIANDTLMSIGNRCNPANTTLVIENTAIQIVPFPNPTTGLLYLYHLRNKTQYVLMDIYGMVHLKGYFHEGNNILQIANIVSGIYYLQLTDDLGQKNTFKIEKK
jgi:hypothetical protein